MPILPVSPIICPSLSHQESFWAVSSTMMPGLCASLLLATPRTLSEATTSLSMYRLAVASYDRIN